MFETSYTTVHPLGVEETPDGILVYTLVVNGTDVLVRRKVQDAQWRTLESEVVPADALTRHTIKGKNLWELVAEARAALSRGGKVVPVG